MMEDRRARGVIVLVMEEVNILEFRSPSLSVEKQPVETKASNTGRPLVFQKHLSKIDALQTNKWLVTLLLHTLHFPTLI